MYYLSIVIHLSYKYVFNPHYVAFPGGTCKELPASAGDTIDMGSIPGSGRSPGGGKWQPIPVFLPEKSHGWRSLVGCSPWGREELDTE